VIKEGEWRFNVVLGSREAGKDPVSLHVLWWSSEISYAARKMPSRRKEVHFPQPIDDLVPTGNRFGYQTLAAVPSGFHRGFRSFRLLIVFRTSMF